jgi:hypothetical protein
MNTYDHPCPMNMILRSKNKLARTSKHRKQNY